MPGLQLHESRDNVVNNSLYYILCISARFTLTANNDKLTASQHCRRPPPCLLIAVVQSATAHALTTASIGQQREVHFNNSLVSLQPYSHFFMTVFVGRKKLLRISYVSPLCNTIIVHSGQRATMHSDEIQTVVTGAHERRRKYLALT